MSKYKNQHFIPKKYFRNFSDNPKTIDVYLIDENSFRVNASIKSQACGNFFYGDHLVEGVITEIENYLDPIIGKLISNYRYGDIEISMDEKLKILQSIVLQKTRTKNERDANEGAAEKFLLSMFSEHLRHTDGDLYEKFKKFGKGARIEFTGYINMMIKESLDFAWLGLDLGLALAHSNNGGFIFGDSPSLIYNQYLCNINDRGVNGLQTPGIIMIYPISKNLCLLALDSEIYDLGLSDDRIRVFDIDENDLNELNCLQYLYASKCLYYKGDAQRDRITRIVSDCKDTWKPRKIDVNQYKSDSDSSLLYHQFERQIEYQAKFSFSKKPPMDRGSYSPMYRSQEMVDTFRSRRLELNSDV